MGIEYLIYAEILEFAKTAVPCRPYPLDNEGAGSYIQTL
jgi:hypothetical protein